MHASAVHSYSASNRPLTVPFARSYVTSMRGIPASEAPRLNSGVVEVSRTLRSLRATRSTVAIAPGSVGVVLDSAYTPPPLTESDGPVSGTGVIIASPIPSSWASVGLPQTGIRLAISPRAGATRSSSTATAPPSTTVRTP
jgi:hypothetical protein